MIERVSDILTAKMKDGTIISSTEIPKDRLRALRETTTFFCTQCETVVQLKVGDIVIPHFAHVTDQSCTTLFSEGESAAHLLGKQQLYEFFQSKCVTVKLEPYFKSLAQRPDLFVKSETEAIPVEFQCSPISLPKKVARTDGYVNAGMKPVWILQTAEKHKARSPRVNAFSFSRFEQSFFTYTFPEGNVLLTYDPHLKKFHYFSTLLHVSGNQYIGLHRILSIGSQTWPFARPKTPTTDELLEYLKIYRTKRERFLKSRILLNRKGINDSFLRACYELRLIPELLPKWVGLPVTFNRSFHEHACEWQLALIYFMERQRIGFKRLSDAKIHRFVESMGSPSKAQVTACLNYRDLFLSLEIDRPDMALEMDEGQVVELLKATMVAKRKDS